MLFDNKTYDEKLEIIEEGNFIVHLEEIGEVDVADMNIDEIDFLVSVLEDQGYEIHNENYEILYLLNFDEITEDRQND